MQHRRQTGLSALRAAGSTRVRAAVGVLLACCALAASAVAAAGGADTDPAAAVLQIARNQLGDPYAWGATGPDSWDCSGLTSRLWREVGGVADIPRVARDQQAWAIPIPVEQLQVGDLVFFGNPVSHVALYAGNGEIVDASSSNHKVVQRKIWSSGVVRYGRVPRPTMPKVIPWTPPVLPTPSPSATSAGSTSGGTTSPARRGTPAPSASPTAASPTAASPTVKPTTAPAPVSAAASAAPLRGLPAPDLAALTSVAAAAARNAQTVRGSTAWTDTELVRAAWRHAGGGLLPTGRVALVATGAAVPVGAARIGDVVVYGTPASHVGVYLGHGYMVDASPSLGRVVVRRVYTSQTVRIVRIPVQ